MSGMHLLRGNIRGFGANLRGANLRCADMRGTNLRGTDMRDTDMRGTDMRGANLRGANLRGADVTSILISPEGEDQEKWMYTQLNMARNLTQTQLDEMNGDSGTIIPSHLTRPAHWPDLDKDGRNGDRPKPTKAEQAPSLEPESLMEDLAKSSPVGYQEIDGKLSLVDLPIGAVPPARNPVDLRNRAKGQIALIKTIKKDLSSSALQNFDKERLINRLTDYDEILKNGLTIWYTPNDAVGRIQCFMKQENADTYWCGHLVNDLKRLIKNHDDMAPLLKPQGSDDAIAPPADIKNFPKDTKPVLRAIRKPLEHDGFRQIADDNTCTDFKSDFEHTNQAQDECLRPSENEKEKKEVFAGLLSKLLSKLSSFTKALKVAVDAHAILNSPAVQQILAYLDELLSLIRGFFL